MQLRDLLSHKTIKARHIPAHVARTKKALREARDLLLEFRADPTLERAQAAAARSESLIILLAGLDPANTRLEDVQLNDDKSKKPR